MSGKEILKDMKILVTGATGGIGSSIARLLWKDGSRLVLAGRNSDKGLKLADELGGTFFLSADFEKEKPADIISRAAAFMGGLDCLINCAGVVFSGRLEETGFEDFDRVMNLNVRVPYFMCREALPFLYKSEKPVIVNIGSVVSIKGYPEQSAYAASKHALLGFSKSLAAEVYSKGIRVHTVLPGGVETPMVYQVRPDIPVENLISPEEVAESVRFLIGFGGRGVIDEIRIHRANSQPWA